VQLTAGSPVHPGPLPTGGGSAQLQICWSAGHSHDCVAVVAAVVAGAGAGAGLAGGRTRGCSGCKAVVAASGAAVVGVAVVGVAVVGVAVVGVAVGASVQWS